MPAAIILPTLFFTISFTIWIIVSTPQRRPSRTTHEFPNTKSICSALLLVFGSIQTSRAQEVHDGVSQNVWKIPSDEDVRKLLAARLEKNGVGIAVAIAEPGKGRVIVYGRSGTERPLDGDTVFQIGSLTKTFTTLLLADMVQRGEVKLDDPAATLLPPGVRMPELGRPITLKHLATHMSGLPSMPTNYDLKGEPTPYEAYTAEQLYQFLSTFQLPREPEVKSQYSNLGVALLGRLLGNRKSMQYETLLTERVLKPLGMRSTAVKLTAEQTRRLARGHDRYLQPVATWEMTSMPASGSLRSTPNDMLRFLSSYLRSDSPLKAAADIQLSVRQPVSTGVIALSWGVRQSGEGDIYAHDGGKEGFRSAMVFNPKARIGVVVLANARTDDLPITIAMHLLTGRPLPAAPAAPAAKQRVALDTKVLDSYAGRYGSTQDLVLTVARRENHLIVQVGGGGGINEIFATGPRDFFLITGNDEFTVQVDSRGRSTGLMHYPNGKADGPAEFIPRINSD